MPISDQQYREMLGRVERNRGEPTRGEQQDAVRESALQQEIIDDCRHRGWQAFYSRMDRETTNRLGTPDFIIQADAGRTFYIEAKSKTGKRSMKQLEVAAFAKKLGHTVHLVHSIGDFRAIVDA